MKLSISVMAHPSREKHFEYLKERLGNPKFSIDVDSKGLIWNCERAWKMYDLDSDYHVVIQDDAIVCDNFKERAEKIIEKEIKDRGEMVFNFYYGTREMLKKEAEEGLKNGYVISNRPRWGVAICLPTRLIPEMLNMFQLLNNKQDDERISRFIGVKKLKVFFPMPSLIDHRSEEKSLVENTNSGGRRAYKFINNN